MTQTIEREETFYVLRYKQDVPLQLRVHKHTLGRHASRGAALVALTDLPDDVYDIIEIEERTEVWEEDVEIDEEMDE